MTEPLSEREADALASMLSGVDERVMRLENATPCRIDHMALARLLEGIDGKIESAVERALIAHTARMAHPEDKQLKPVVVRAADHAGEHIWDRFSKRFTLAVMLALLSILLAAAAFVGTRLGVIK